MLGHLISYRSLNREQDNVTVVSNFESGRHHREYATPQLQAPGPCRTEFSDVGFDLIVVGTKFLMNSIVQNRNYLAFATTGVCRPLSECDLSMSFRGIVVGTTTIFALMKSIVRTLNTLGSIRKGSNNWRFNTNKRGLMYIILKWELRGQSQPLKVGKVKLHAARL